MLHRSFLVAACVLPVFGQYTYYSGDSFSTVDTTKWWVNSANGGSLNGSANGLYGNGSLISKVAVPDGSSDYEVKATFVPSPWSISHWIYLRASSDTFGSCGVSGTYYAIRAYDNSGGLGLVVTKRVGGTITQLFTTNAIPLTNPATIRASIRSDGDAAGITLRVGAQSWFIADTSITSGQPGVGVAGCTSVSYSSYPFTRVDVGPLDRVGPNTSSSIASAPFPDKVILSWSAVLDNVAGVGTRQYHVLRNGVLVTKTTNTTIVNDAGIAANTTYNYSVIAEDWHGSKSSAGLVSVTTPGYSNPDPRRTGITPTGSYWGAMGEQIDLLSGNVNFTVPLLKAVSRSSWSVGFNLAYNSQSFRYVTSPTAGTIVHGADVGYGFGWRLLAGAIVPVYNGSTISHYLFLDSTGGEHKLNFNDSGVWRGTSGLLVEYNETLNRLYFNDGSFWQMDCISGGTEQDLGTRYPTLMQDSNGNQVAIRYMPAIGTNTINTSARIKEIEDVRAVSNSWGGTVAYRTFQFTYNSDPIPHLTNITNNINTGEKYDFTYTGPVSLKSPFDGSNIPGVVSLLSNITVTGLGIGHTFEYTNIYAELTKVIFPYGGELRYVYSGFAYAGGHKLREITSRSLVKQPGAAPSAYVLSRDAGDSARPMHYLASINDPSGTAKDIWYFSTAADWTMGLQTRHEKRALPGSTIKLQEDSTWGVSPSGFAYTAAMLNTVDPGTAFAKTSKVEQTVDAYGNLLQKKEYDFGNLTTPSRTTNCTYITTATYLSRYLRNLLSSCSLSAGSTSYTLVTNTYDGAMDTQNLYGVRLHDSANYGTGFTTRGNLTAYTGLKGLNGTAQYNMVGALRTKTGGGLANQMFNYNGTYSAPNLITANGSSETQTTFAYTSFLGLANATQASGKTVSFTYDAYARTDKETTPDGDLIYTYATAAPFWKKAEIAGMWTKTWYDGLGRVIKEESGDGSGTKSIVDTEYDACACSPIGKTKRVSRPYAPGGTVYWTTYMYDALGRTISVSQPGNSGTTTYSYQGNTTTVTDPAGRWKKFTSNAFGNLIQVNEPNPAGGADYVTTYTYNAFNKLAQVSMPRPTGTQTRTFAYDTQGRLISETHPENGVTTYAYPGYASYTSDLPMSKTDARGIRTEWSYDVYRRVYQERKYIGTLQDTCAQLNYRYGSYSDGSIGGSYVWGRLAEVTWGNEQPGQCLGIAFKERYLYDVHGRMNGKRIIVRRAQHSIGGAWTPPYWAIGEGQLSAGWSWSFGQIVQISYPYWHEGVGVPAPSFGTYPEGRLGETVSVALDSMKRPLSVTRNPNNGNPIETVVNNIAYNAAGAITQLQYNSITETRDFNVLGQITGISYNGTLRHEYRYSATNNDGGITSYKNWQSGEDVQYQYDSLGRLTSAATVGPEWGQSYGYDGFGNLWSKTTTKGSLTPLNVTIDPVTNRISGAPGVTYDLNGNMTSIGVGSGTLYYDHRNRYTGDSASLQISRVYDPQNRLIAKVGPMVRESDVTTVDNLALTVDFYLPDGRKLGTYNQWFPSAYRPGGYPTETLAFKPAVTHTYLGNRLIKSVPRSGATTWTQQDRLGSAVNHLPYGEERTVTTQGTMKFATYWRESNGLDYAMNRYYSSSYGRFTTPDPFRASAGPENPASWNRYAYVDNDPINYYDPEGLDSIRVSTDPVTVSATMDPLLTKFLDTWGYGITPQTGFFDWDLNWQLESQMRCKASVSSTSGMARANFENYLEKTFTPNSSANATGLKTGIGLAIASARGLAFEEISGAIGAALGGFVGWVTGTAAGYITGPIVDPVIKDALLKTFDYVNSGIDQTLNARCEGRDMPIPAFTSLPFLAALPIPSTVLPSSPGGIRPPGSTRPGGGRGR